MIRFIQSFILVITVIGMQSCGKGFLEVNTQPAVTRQGYVKDLATLEHFYNGIYILLNKDYEKGIGAAYPEMVSDNLKPASNASTKALVSHYIWSQQAVNATDEDLNEKSVCANGLWRNGGYSIIRSCDFVLEEIGKYRNENPEKADKIKGEILALRAMIHFRLVNIFAQPYKFTPDASHLGIPYITFSDITVQYQRKSVKEVYDLIIADFNEALTLLPQKITDTRKMNRAAVKGLLARTYLFKEDFSTARQLSEELIQQYPPIAISEGYPDAVYKHLPIEQNEVLFQLTPINISSSNASRYLSQYLRYTPSILFHPTKDIVEIIRENPNDIRSSWITVSGMNDIVTKFPRGVGNEAPAPRFAENNYYPCLIRSSELTLTAAEAAARLNQEDIARKHLNDIRKRADHSIEPVLATGQALLDSIYKERRKELCFEGWRLYDLQRWKMGIHRKDVSPEYPSFKDLNYPNDKAIAPIPFQEVQFAGLVPNPGY